MKMAEIGEEKGAGGAVSRTLPGESNITTPLSQEMHEKHVQMIVQSEMEGVKREMAQRVNEMEVRFHKNFADLAYAVKDLRAALNVKTEPLDLEVKRDKEMSKPVSPPAEEGAVKPVAPVQSELPKEPVAKSEIEEVLEEPVEKHKAIVYADPVKPNLDVLKRVPEYNGDIPWQEYYTQFTLIRNAYHWTDEEATIYLVASLRGPAVSALSYISDAVRKKFSTFVEALERRFGESFGPSVYKARLKARLRRKGEPLPQLAQEIEKLVFKAYVEIDYIPKPFAEVHPHNTMAKDYFIDALNDRELQLHVMQSHPKTLSDALTSALELESFLKALPKENNNGDRFTNNTESKYTPWKPRMHNRDEGSRPTSPMVRARPAQTSDRAQHPPQWEGTCWWCGERGHRKGQCPRRNVNTPSRREAGPQGRSGSERGEGETYTTPRPRSQHNSPPQTGNGVTQVGGVSRPPMQ